MNIDTIKRNVIWYLNESESALGMRSNFLTILSTAYGSLPNSDNENNMIGSLKKVRRHRIILQSLSHLSQTEYRYLQALYCDEYQQKYPKIIKVIFEKQTGLALCLFDDLKVLSELCTKKRHQALNPDEEKKLTNLQEQTNAIYTKLHNHLQEIMR